MVIYMKDTADLKYSEIYTQLASEEINPLFFNEMGNCIFKCNEWSSQLGNDALRKILSFLNQTEVNKLCLIKTHKLDYIILNKTVMHFLECFDGQKNLKSIFAAIKKTNLDFFLLLLDTQHYLLKHENIIEDIEKKSIAFSLEDSFNNFMRLIKLLYKSHLIELAGYSQTYLICNDIINNSGKINLEYQVEEPQSECCSPKYTSGCSSRILLLGDSVGTNTVGLLYLASYLRRNGVEAYCQWNDPWRNKQLLKENIEKLLQKLKPDIVGISMKWFPHIARALEICRIVKDFSSSIKVVVGGDSATYYWENIIQYECIDYVIRGEGELPLLNLCNRQNEQDIPNCVYKKNGKIITNPHTYVQTADNNSDIYLSHLDEIFASSVDPYYASSLMYISTGRGCASNCFYCGGCLEVQKRNFNRHQPYLRDIEAVRKDIRQIKQYIGTFLYDFDLPHYNSLDYYKKLWEGIDLSNHYCSFYFWSLPSRELLKLITETYKYVYINVDLCSLSESHRMKLTELKVVKPQPTDTDLFAFLDSASEFKNSEIYINLIAGLPYFSVADMEESKAVLARIMSKYKHFLTGFWWRLHAQPGAALSNNAEEYGMRSSAKTFEEFLYYSNLNLDAKTYPEMSALFYPIIYYKDDDLESKVSKFYDVTKKKLLYYYFSQT